MTIDELVDKLLAKNENLSEENQEKVERIIKQSQDKTPFRYITDEKEIETELSSSTPKKTVTTKLSEKTRLIGYDEDNFYVLGDQKAVLDILEKHQNLRKK